MGGEKGGVEAVHRLPNRVGDVVGTPGGGVRGFGEGPRYLFRGEGSIVLVACEVEERGVGGGLGGKKS